MKPTADQLRWMLRTMWEIRCFEEQVLEFYKKGMIRGSTHLYIGQEAIAVGACAALRKDDWVTSTHRGHGHCLAKGGRPDRMLAELLGRATGYCKGKGGSMHIADMDLGITGANGIVGGSMGIAVGAGVSSLIRKTDQVCVCFFGDGAVHNGIYHESLNLASIWKAPVVFICEHNVYAMTVPSKDASAQEDTAELARVAYNMPSVSLDGTDVGAVDAATAEAVGRARAGGGPTYIEAKAYRWYGHMIGDPELYRTKDEVEKWKRTADPIAKLEAAMKKEGVIDEPGARAVEQELRRESEAAAKFAVESPNPSLETLFDDVYVGLKPTPSGRLVSG